MTSLRPYQEQMRRDIAAKLADGSRRVLAQLPTGGGKTVLFADIVQRIRGRVLIAAHRRELIKQASGKLPLAHGSIMPGHPMTRHPVQVGSIQTLTRRLDRLPRFDLIIADEAHHAVAGGWSDLFESQKQATVIGFTATPQRLDGRGLGDVFDSMVVGPDVRSLVADGYLAPARVFAPAASVDVRRLHMLAGDYNPRELETVMDKPSVTGDAVAHYERHCPWEPALAFCVSVAHAEHTAAQFRADGWTSVCIHGGMTRESRDGILANFEAGKINVLTSCDLISEGLDIPRVSAVILLRPTQSLGLYLQMVGRGLRLYAGKTCLTILDHAGNVPRHGMHDEPREWSLEGRKKKAGDPVPATRQCPECFAIHKPAPTCPVCGYEYVSEHATTERSGPERKDGDLVEISFVARNMSLADLLKSNRYGRRVKHEPTHGTEFLDA